MRHVKNSLTFLVIVAIVGALAMFVRSAFAQSTSSTGEFRAYLEATTSTQYTAQQMLIYAQDTGIRTATALAAPTSTVDEYRITYLSINTPTSGLTVTLTNGTGTIWVGQDLPAGFGVVLLPREGIRVGPSGTLYVTTSAAASKITIEAQGRTCSARTGYPLIGGK